MLPSHQAGQAWSVELSLTFDAQAVLQFLGEDISAGTSDPCPLPPVTTWVPALLLAQIRARPVAASAASS